MSFINGDYRDYMNNCKNPSCKCENCTCDPCDCTEENPCVCNFKKLSELRGGQ